MFQASGKFFKIRSMTNHIIAETYLRMEINRGDLQHQPTVISWKGMFNRCYRPKAFRFSLYGGAGVRVCERWFSYENFLADMGERPAGTSLGRFGDVGHYEPDNCAWMTPQEQGAERHAKSAGISPLFRLAGKKRKGPNRVRKASEALKDLPKNAPVLISFTKEELAEYVAAERKKIAGRGGKARAAKHTAADLAKWGAKGGRPKGKKDTYQRTRRKKDEITE